MSPKVSWPRMESLLLRLAGGETWATFSAFWCIRWLNSSVQSLMNFSLTTTVSLKTSAEACLLKGLSTCWSSMAASSADKELGSRGWNYKQNKNERMHWNIGYLSHMYNTHMCVDRFVNVIPLKCPHLRQSVAFRSSYDPNFPNRIKKYFFIPSFPTCKLYRTIKLGKPPPKSTEPSMFLS